MRKRASSSASPKGSISPKNQEITRKTNSDAKSKVLLCNAFFIVGHFLLVRRVQKLAAAQPLERFEDAHKERDKDSRHERDKEEERHGKQQLVVHLFGLAGNI